MIKAAFFITFALFIDLIQALVSFGIFITFAGVSVAATPAGTILGGLGGCILGALVGAVVGAIPGAVAGCVVGGGGGATGGAVVGGAVATIAPATGMALAFVFNLAIGLVLGGLLISLMFFGKILYPRYLTITFAEVIPGINCLPAWTAFVISSLIAERMQKKKQTLKEAGGQLGKIAGRGTALGRGIGAVVAIQEKNMELAREAQPEFFEPAQQAAKEREEKEPNEVRRAGNQLIRDIRPRRA
jgi:hypothetical protein